jgi:hypothetical protein
VELSAELDRRVALLNASFSLGPVPAGDCVWLACDLLVAGVDTPAVTELAGAPPDLTFVDGAALIAAMLDELGLPRLDEITAAWLLAQEIASRMLAGDLGLAAGGSELWTICDSLLSPPDLKVITDGLADWDIMTAVEAPDSKVLARLTRLAEDVRQAATERLGR